LRSSVALLAWASALLIGAVGATLTAKIDVSAPANVDALEQSLQSASLLRLPAAQQLVALAGGDSRFDAWRNSGRSGSPKTTARAAASPNPGDRLLRAAMLTKPTVPHPDLAPLGRTRSVGALSALEAALPGAGRPSPELTAYGELEPDFFAARRLTVLQLGDSHTAADFFTGRVRERLQQVFGAGGMDYLVPGRPHPGVRSALFDSDASDGWSYEALQKSDETRRFYLSGFNAVARHAGASLSLKAKGGLAYDSVQVAFLKQPGGGRAEVLVDGEPSGDISLDGAADQRATLDVNAADHGAHGFHDIAVRSLTDAPVTVTGVEVNREGDGVSYVSLGFPGATVQLLQKLAEDNLADDLKRVAPDVIVLAFGTNEGFNDALDVAAYTAQYEQIVKRLKSLRPQARIVIIGPPDGARANGNCGPGGHDCAPRPASADGAACHLPTPPKLAQVREAQRRLAMRLEADFWDWSSAMPSPCGAQVWAAADPPLMAHDYVHMTTEGYRQSADRFADFLIPLIDGRQTNAHVVSNN
jgi:lysophospholipase L1-like esterase